MKLKLIKALTVVGLIGVAKLGLYNQRKIILKMSNRNRKFIRIK